MSADNLSGAELIAAERLRQIAEEGWTKENDDQYEKGELADAAACYLACHYWFRIGYIPKVGDLGRDCVWPWADDWWKPSSDPIRNLVKAGALIAAEIDRLQRAAAKDMGGV